MLVCEVLCYILLAMALSLALNLILGPLAGNVVSSLFWFFTYRFTVLRLLLVLRFVVCYGKLGDAQGLTHTREKADGVSGPERAKGHDLPQQKGPESAVHQHFEGWQSVGKDEVPLT